LQSKRDGRDATLRQHRGPLELTISADQFGIKQVFRNILENSLAACDDPVKIDVDMLETQLFDRPGLKIVFRDNGPGLTPEARERIFEEFYTTKTHGTGLGMAICKRIVEAHDGLMATGPGPGAEIRITLPYDP
ncbi:MAG: ATP-binding protein, partial [Planctomycetaceae bacterium]|nr:ATP-binding protein [Planctomycetaceae bacterium]